MSRPDPELRLCACGCGASTPVAAKTITRLGHVAGQPRPYVPGHGSRRSDPQWEVAPNGCWLWRWSTNNKGYGRIRVDGAEWLAHRYVYTRQRGPIPPELELDHLCSNRRCVNPDHLEAVPHRVNCRRGRRAILGPGGALAIKLAAATTTLSHRAIAEMVAIDHRTVGRVIGGQRWA
jgi:hypothetical protein